MKPLSRPRFVDRMVEHAGEIKRRLLAESGQRLNIVAASLSADLARDVPPEEAADTLAQAIACAAPILAQCPASCSAAIRWLGSQAKPWEKTALEEAQLSQPLAPSPSLPLSPSQFPPHHLYDSFLHQHAHSHRKRRGVFFTPQPIADYIVSAADSLARTELQLATGLADSATRIIDPACGTGVFPLAVIDRLYRQTAAQCQAQGGDASDVAAAWSACASDLLGRLLGIEILPAAAFLAKLNIALKLAETAYDFCEHRTINILVADALSPLTQSTIQNSTAKIPVLLGNPPFSSLTTATNDWIARLVRGDDEVRGYVRAGSQLLGERKTWLHDDYVKFIRLAQWHVEEAGAGIVGLVTNHGYLDNATFRLMRHELLRVFPRVQILDLHGNRKKHEVAPSGERDENVFGLDQGVAIGLFCRPTPTRSVREGVSTQARSASEGHRSSIIEHADLWGTRAGKLATLASAASISAGTCRTPPLMQRVSVQSPEWRFIPTPCGARRPAEYDRGWSLADAMPVNTPAPVTARDHFVVAFTANELQARIEQFRDLSIPDDEIRRRYFQRTRSARYALGDTRGWKLTAARRIIAADADWQQSIVRCLYRPFDWRYVFWHPAMIDWPRENVTRHLIGGQSSEFKVQGSKPALSTLNLELGTLNWCLIARRQQLPTQPCTFFWVCDGLALDGVIRSDNRGSESLFPIYVAGTLRVPLESQGRLWPPSPSDGTRSVPATFWQANFAAEFVEQLAAATGLAWLPIGRGDLTRTFGPEDLAAYIYALFHSPTYRDRYAEALRTDFPRVLIPRTADLLRSLCRCGNQLIEQHLLRGPTAPAMDVMNRPALRSQNVLPSTRYSVHSTHAGEACIGGKQPAPNAGLSDAVESFRAGGYVALRKWLQPQHRSASDPEYARIVAAITRTLEIMPAIDAGVAAHGGWEAGFVS